MEVKKGLLTQTIPVIVAPKPHTRQKTRMHWSDTVLTWDSPSNMRISNTEKDCDVKRMLCIQQEPKQNKFQIHIHFWLMLFCFSMHNWNFIIWLKNKNSHWSYSYQISTNSTIQWHICHTSYVDCLLVRSGWNCNSILTSLVDSQHN